MLLVLLISFNICLVGLALLLFRENRRTSKYIEDKAKEYNFKKKPDATNTRP